ncbi:hypothetical protein [Dyella sp. C9]|uniref:hypothetical protein n=1 Tax=Dyella sp. C9 TaxID=2202154 RepID=UPI00130043D5|nr:hypothetical protein [Dyella sp. C9]
MADSRNERRQPEAAKPQAGSKLNYILALPRLLWLPLSQPLPLTRHRGVKVLRHIGTVRTQRWWARWSARTACFTGLLMQGCDLPRRSTTFPTRLGAKFKLSLFALKTPKPASERPEGGGRDLALAEGFAGRNQAVLADTPAKPCAGKIVPAFDLIL